jgi:hypothetical protein
MKSTVSPKLAAAADLGALIMSGLYTVFYLSYVARHLVEGRANSLAELYDRDAAFNSAAGARRGARVGFVVVGVFLSGARLHKDPHPYRPIDPNRPESGWPRSARGLGTFHDLCVEPIHVL